ncbi:unnamed protein product [Debaryomyces tyrocola]|nr:unnamed protein product [Debaryomyces tyrocola]
MHYTHTHDPNRRQMSCPILKIFKPASFATKMEAYGIRIVDINGVSILTHEEIFLTRFPRDLPRDI